MEEENINICILPIKKRVEVYADVELELHYSIRIIKSASMSS